MFENTLSLACGDSHTKIMSDAVNAAIIGAGAAVLVAVIGVVWKNKRNSKQQPSKQGTLSHVGSITNSTININSPQAASPKVKLVTEPKSKPRNQDVDERVRAGREMMESFKSNIANIDEKGVTVSTKPIADLTYKQIIDTIETAAPFHQTKIKESFIGKKIAWQVKLTSIKHERRFISKSFETYVSADFNDGKTGLLCLSSPENAEVVNGTHKDSRWNVSAKGGFGFEQSSKRSSPNPR